MSTIENRVNRTYAMGQIAVEAMKAAEEEKAREIFCHCIEIAQTMESEVDADGVSLKAGTLEIIAIRMAEAGWYDQALEVARGIEDGEAKDPALETIAIILANSGLCDRAVTVAMEIGDDYWKASTLEHIIKLCPL